MPETESSALRLQAINLALTFFTDDPESELYTDFMGYCRLCGIRIQEEDGCDHLRSCPSWLLIKRLNVLREGMTLGEVGEDLIIEALVELYSNKEFISEFLAGSEPCPREIKELKSILEELGEIHG